MIIYNVTVKINVEVHDEWLTWMQEVHIPDVLQTGRFEGYQIAKVLGQDESDGFTYAIQYTCKDMATLHQYIAHDAPKLQKDHTDRYQNKFVAYRTFLEIVDRS